MHNLTRHPKRPRPSKLGMFLPRLRFLLDWDSICLVRIAGIMITTLLIKQVSRTFPCTRTTRRAATQALEDSRLLVVSFNGVITVCDVSEVLCVIRVRVGVNRIHDKNTYVRGMPFLNSLKQVGLKFHGSTGHYGYLNALFKCIWAALVDFIPKVGSMARIVGCPIYNVGGTLVSEAQHPTHLEYRRVCSDEDTLSPLQGPL